VTAATAVGEVPARGPWALALETLLRDRTAMFGACLIALLVGLAIAAPLVASDPLDQDLANTLRPPSAEHLFGTDEYGRDVLSRVLHGARLSLTIGFIAVSISIALGLPIGLLAGYAGGLTETLIMRAMDLVLAFPPLLLVLVVVAILGTGLENAMIAIGFAAVPDYVRLVRASTVSAMHEDYVTASRSVGCSPIRIMRVHLLPNVMSPLLVVSTLRLATAILVGSTLGFLGLGAQPPTPEWGVMLANAAIYVRDAWWLSTFPGLAVLLAVLGMNLLGDGVRDAVDPKLRTHRWSTV
jgi:peptide/nickel transport system permease protein